MLADTQAPSSVSRTESASPSKEKPNLNVQYGLNAIAVLTNQPNKAPARIHRSDLPTVPRTHYPKIKTSDFDEYLQSISTLFEQYSSNMSEFGLDSVSEYGGKDAAGTASDVLGKGGAESQAADAVTGNSLGVTNQLPGIEDVPTIFFEENFDLRDPAVFDIATQVVLGPHNATAGLFSPEKSAETSATMQETLSAYMDVVEAYLTREISRRSPSFFAALSMLKELHAETDNCIEKIHVLRDDLKGTAQSQCLPGLELIRLRRRRDNLSTVLSNIQLLGNLRHIQPTVDELIGSGDYIGALNLITEAQEMIEPVKCQAQQGTSDFGLVGTKAFRHLSSRMDKSLKSVSLHAEQELATIIMRDMREFVEDGLSNSDDGLLSMSQVDIYQANLSMQLTPFICGLVRTGGIGSALKAYGDSIMSETAVLIESLYPNGFPRSQGHASFNDASQQRALGTAVRNQTFDQFRALIKQQQALLLLIIGHISMRYGSAQTEVIRSLNDTFDAFMDVAHVRCAKLLNHRSEQNARLSLTGFYSLYTSIWQFIVQYEQLGSKMCFGLRGTLTAQAKAFLNNFHIEKSRQIQILIENEQWVQAEVPIDFQNLVNQVVNAAYASTEATNDDQGALALEAPSSQQQPNSPVVTKHADSFSSISNVQMLSRQDSDAASIRSADTAGIGLMHIGGESFHVVGCSLVLVKSVVEYLQCAVNIPMLVTDVLQRLVEVFKSFNSRTCQVVLGAGAMRSAGLKNISAKHIALASESLALCMELIPYVKECLRHVMSSSQAVLLSQLDRTVNDFVNHQHELHRKLVTIMTDRADYHARML
ncbi:Vps54-like protein-domain-containing protein, partial [Coemansia spiralis]